LHLQHQRMKRMRTIVVGVGTVAVLAGLTGCGDEHEAAAQPDRPHITFQADDTSITAPERVPGGLVDITLATEPGEQVHHIFVARLNDGVSFEEAMADDESFFTKMTIKGGNGVVEAGSTVEMTMNLDPGDYFVLDNPQNEDSPTDTFTVVDGPRSAVEPAAKGTVHLGPGMSIHVPEGFDARGVWKFVNDDPAEAHEAAMVRMAPGKHAADVVEWFHAGDESAPPPFGGDFGSMGALGPGETAWITLAPGEPGDYVLICFIPGRDGIPHVAKGMVTDITVE
jgi:uncharacterized cupredoxin-like copper-binding protein